MTSRLLLPMWIIDDIPRGLEDICDGLKADCWNGRELSRSIDRRERTSQDFTILYEVEL